MNTNRTTWQRLVFMAVWCSLIVSLASSQTKPNRHVSSPATRRDLDAFIRQLIDNAGMPGLQAVVVKDGKIVWSGSYGDAVLDVPGPRRSMRNDSIIHIASTSKILVAIAVLQQVEKGKLSLDDDINKYVPFPVRNPRWPDVPITWRILLTHTSSIDDMDQASDDARCVFGKDDPETFEDYVKNRFEVNGRYYASNLYRIGKPGSERIYTNDGIALAAFALENIVHESFASYVLQTILDPLKMNATGYFLAPLPADRLTVGYVTERKPDGTFAHILPRTFLEHKPPSGTVSDNQISYSDYPVGGIHTTATDYARLMMMFQNRGTLDGAKILNPSSVELMCSPSGYRNLDGWVQGLGLLGPEDLRGRQLWGHDGSDRAYVSAFFFSPKTHVGAIVFANANYPDYSLSYALLDLDLHLMSWFEDPDSKLQGSAQSSGQIEKLKLPGPHAQNQLLGSWSILAEGSPGEGDPITNIPEALGIVRASRAAELPVVISFTLATDGRLPTGQTLQQAIEAVDDATDHAAACFMINCAHPTHFDVALATSEPWIQRLRGVRADASKLSHTELNEASDLDDGDPQQLAVHYSELRRRQPHISVFGGCCGTDHRHIGEIALSCKRCHT